MAPRMIFNSYMSHSPWDSYEFGTHPFSWLEMLQIIASENCSYNFMVRLLVWFDRGRKKGNLKRRPVKLSSGQKGGRRLVTKAD